MHRQGLSVHSDASSQHLHNLGTAWLHAHAAKEVLAGTVTSTYCVSEGADALVQDPRNLKLQLHSIMVQAAHFRWCTVWYTMTLITTAILMHVPGEKYRILESAARAKNHLQQWPHSLLPSIAFYRASSTFLFGNIALLLSVALTRSQETGMKTRSMSGP
jgi:hypothetical protein